MRAWPVCFGTSSALTDRMSVGRATSSDYWWWSRCLFISFTRICLFFYGVPTVRKVVHQYQRMFHWLV